MPAALATLVLEVEVLVAVVEVDLVADFLAAEAAALAVAVPAEVGKHQKIKQKKGNSNEFPFFCYL